MKKVNMSYITTDKYICIYCGKPLTVRKRIYCDTKCKRNYEKITTVEERHRNLEIINSVRLRPEKQCAYCGISFISRAVEKRQYCSSVCHNKAQSEYFASYQIEKTNDATIRSCISLSADGFVCIFCGKQLVGEKLLYCDRNCERDYKRITSPEERLKNHEILNARRLSRQKTECAYCGKLFTSSACQNRKYCSRDCYNNARAVENTASKSLKKAEIFERINDVAVISEFICIYCGEPLPRPEKGKGNILYCSNNCRDKYKRIITPEEQVKILEIIKSVRLHPEKKCACCGKIFTAPRHENRVYCSKSCKEKDQSEYFLDIATQREQEIAVRLYKLLAGIERACIYCGKPLSGGWKMFCDHKCSSTYNNTKIKTSVVKIKPRDIATAYHHPETECEYCKELFYPHVYRNQKHCSRDCYYNAYSPYLFVNNIRDWLKVLHSEMQRNDFSATGVISNNLVHLICEKINICKSNHTLASIVSAKGLDPFNGDYYAFCGGMQNTIRFIWWSNYGFQMTQWQRYHGTFDWIPEKFGDCITLTAEEFEFILKGSKQPEFPEKIII